MQDEETIKIATRNMLLIVVATSCFRKYIDNTCLGFVGLIVVIQQATPFNANRK